MGEISILHLSDIHFKKNKDDNDQVFRLDVQEKMLKAIEGHLATEQILDFIVVTGDIAFSGKKQEYAEAEKFFDKLKTIVSPECEVLLVPGNHDVDRREVDEFLSLQKNIVKEDKADEFLKKRNNIRKYITPKFRAFRKFSDIIIPDLYENPSNIFWVKDISEKNVSFVGVNSSWASEGDSDQTNLALGFLQVKAAFQRASTENRILLMHHPIFNWFDERDFHRWYGEVINNCTLILHGHEHFDRASSISTPSDSFVCLGANSCYTKESNSHIGFQFLKVTYDSNGMKVVVWPYKMDMREKIQFFPDTMRWERQDSRPYFTFSTNRTHEPDDPIETFLRIPDRYREWIEDFHSTLPIDQLAKKGEAFSVPLPRVYIPLETANPFYIAEMKGGHSEKKKRGGSEEHRSDKVEAAESFVIDIEELLARQKMVLLRGEPGMGKTTLIRHLAYTVVHGQAKPGLQGYLPVIVFLKELWPLFEKEIGDGKNGINFESMLRPYFEKKDCPLKVNVLTKYMTKGKVVFLIDGLDEVPEHLRGPLVEKIAQFRSKNKTNRFLLTSRPHGVNGLVMARFGNFLQDIELLDQKKIAGFITDWFREVCGKAKGIAKNTAYELIGDISSNEYVSVFVRNPLLLTAVCILYQDNKKLPDQRADLYGRVVDNLLCKRFLDPADPDNVPRLEAFLMRLAFSMHEKYSKHMDPYGVKELLKQYYPKKENEKSPEYTRRIGRLFEEIEPNCGLLKRQSGDEVEFFHLTFQEFMSAKYMIDKNLDYKNYLHNVWWDETILLYAGLMSQHSGEEGNRIAKEILEFNGENREQQHRFCLLGSNALQDMLSFKRSPEVVELSQKNLKEMMATHEDLAIRLKAEEMLGVLGDDRFTDFEMIEVEAGEFIRGSREGESFDREEPSRKIYLDSFFIGKYPVTNREFKEFVDSGGYKQEEVWHPEGWQHVKEAKINRPWYWRDPKWNGLNFPVIGVSWYECDAFCRWLSEKTGLIYRLPTEAEWEKASRGTDGRLWPWSGEFNKELCNSDEIHLGRTSPVGIFSGGESPYGCMDMAGNVWEWCQDWFSEEYYRDSPNVNPSGPENGEGRVMRGGSWFNKSAGCRCAYRIDDLPVYRGYGVGFRLARSF